MSVIFLFERRLFLRDCLQDCFSRLHPNHEIVSYCSLAEWSAAGNKSKPAIIVYSVPAGINLLMKSEFEQLLKAAPDVPIIVVGDVAKADDIARIIDYGARGYIPTSMALQLAVEAVRFVEAGGTFVPAGQFLSRCESNGNSHAAPVLTERQMTVVEAVGRGFPNKQIAYRLKMSENTVKVHLRHIMKKLNMKNRTEIALWTRTASDPPEYRGGGAGVLQDHRVV